MCPIAIDPFQPATTPIHALGFGKGPGTQKAGVAAGDVIERVGPAQPRTLAELYRAIWATGAAGATVDLGLARKDGGSSSLAIKSMNRLDHLKLGSSF